MPESLSDLVTLLDLETLDLDLFRGRQPETGMQRVFGGQVLGQALVAAARTVDKERDVHSLHGHFLRGGDTAVPIIYDVERMRDGRSFSTRRVKARQHGRDIFYLVASFQLQEEGFDHQDAMPDVPPPDDCPTLGELFQRITGQSIFDWEREWAALDVRYVGDSRPGGMIPDSQHPAQSRLWLRAAQRLPDDPMLHKCVLSYASDLTLLGAALVPHRTFIGDPRLRPASLDHAMWFHRRFRADEWLLYDQVSPSASGARGLVVGRLFAATGELVATVTQEGLIRYVGDRR